MTPTEILQGLKKPYLEGSVRAVSIENDAIRNFNAGIDACIAALGYTDLVKALEGLRLHPLGSDRHVNEIAAHNEAIDRAIEIVRGLRGT